MEGCSRCASGGSLLHTRVLRKEIPRTKKCKSIYKMGSALSPKTSKELPKSAQGPALWFIVSCVLLNNTMCRPNAQVLRSL